MANRDLIIPARFEPRDAAAGLKGFGEGGTSAGPLESLASAASTFRKAHESVESAMNEFGRLVGALRHPTADEPSRGSGAMSTAEGWPGPAAGLRALGSRLGGPGIVAPEDASASPRPGAAPTSPSGPADRRDAARSDPSPDAAPPGIPAGAVGPMSAAPIPGPVDVGAALASRGGPSLAASARAAPTPTVAPDDPAGSSRGVGPARNPTAGDPLGGAEILAELRRGRDPAQGTGPPAVEAGRAGRTARDAIAEFLGQSSGWRDGERRGAAALTPDAAPGAEAAPCDRPDPRRSAESWLVGEGPREGFTPRDSSWNAGMSTAAPAPFAGRDAESPTTRDGARASPGGLDPRAGPGDATTAAIEKLLREQNDLIRMDLQRGANQPIAAPPPLRGGGLRM